MFRCILVDPCTLFLLDDVYIALSPTHYALAQLCRNDVTLGLASLRIEQSYEGHPRLFFCVRMNTQIGRPTNRALGPMYNGLAKRPTAVYAPEMCPELFSFVSTNTAYHIHIRLP